MKNYLVIFFYFFLSGTSAQHYPHNVPFYDFIRYDSNQIKYFSSDQPLAPFYNKLDELITHGVGNVNILHFGGSHIQADIWSGQLRAYLQQVAPGVKGARGLVFPFDIAKTNNPSNYKTEFTGIWNRKRNVSKDEEVLLGLTGMQVYTSTEGAKVKMYAKSRYYDDYDFNEVKIFYEMEESSYHIQVANAQSVTYDSSLGCVIVRFDKFRDTLSFKLIKTDSLQRKFTLYGVQFASSDPGILYHAMGVNGADVPSYLSCKLIEKQLPAINPDLIIFSIGINDAYNAKFTKQDYKNNYKQLIERIRNVYPTVPILFTTNNDSYFKNKHPNKNALLVVEAMQELCVEENAAMWNLFEVMGGLGAIDKWVALGLAKSDKIHFTADGYKLVAALMFSALMKDYQLFLKLKS